MAYHTTSNWLGEPTRFRLEEDPDQQYERWRDEIEIQNAMEESGGSYRDREEERESYD